MDLIKDSRHMSWSEWKLKDRYIPFTLEEAQASFRTTFCSKHEDGRIVLLRSVFPPGQHHLPHGATQELQSLAGNGMHMRAILAAMAIVLKSMDPKLMRKYLK